MDMTVLDKTKSLTEEQLTLVDKIIQCAAAVEELQLKDDTEMSVTFVDNQEIQEINREYRNKDQATDVISFAIEDEMEEEFSAVFEEFDLPRDIGDIFVSVDKIKEQAEEYAHSFDRELGFLIVHGFLHLNGYDHMTEEDEKEMFNLQRKILDNYGLKR